MCVSFPSAGHSGPKTEAEKRETSEKVSPRCASPRTSAPARPGAACDRAGEVAESAGPAGSPIPRDTGARLLRARGRPGGRGGGRGRGARKPAAGSRSHPGHPGLPGPRRRGHRGGRARSRRECAPFPARRAGPGVADPSREGRRRAAAGRGSHLDPRAREEEEPSVRAEREWASEGVCACRLLVFPGPCLSARLLTTRAGCQEVHLRRVPGAS